MSDAYIAAAAKAAYEHIKEVRDSLIECNTLRRNDGSSDMRTLPRQLRVEVRLLDNLIKAIEADQ